MSRQNTMFPLPVSKKFLYGMLLLTVGFWFTHILYIAHKLNSLDNSSSISTTLSSFCGLRDVVTDYDYSASSFLSRTAQAPSPILPKIVFGGVMRNMNKEDPAYLSYFIPKLLKLARSITSEFHIVIYENDSVDDTRATLLRFFGNKSYANLLLQDDVPFANAHARPISKVRTNRMAASRNNVLDFLMEHKYTLFQNYDYFAMVDMDGVCGGKNVTLSYDPHIFKYALLDLKERWDAITFRFEPYFDLWAFRHELYQPDNYWYSNKGRKLKGTTFHSQVFSNVSWPDGLVKVESSFAMFAIYRMSLLRKNGTEGVIKYSGSDGKHPDCEHVAFHRTLRQKTNARLRLSPLVYCQGDPGYKPLPERITSQWQ